MRRYILGTLALLASAGFMLSSCGGSSSAQSPFERLGGEAGIRKVVDDTVPCLATDPNIGIFFRGLSADSLERIKVCLTKQLCAAAGGPCTFPTTITYTSPVDGVQRTFTCRPMRAAHQGMVGPDGKGIANDDVDSFKACVQKSMQKNGVPDDLQQAVLNILESQRNDVVDDRNKGK